MISSIKNKFSLFAALTGIALFAFSTSSLCSGQLVWKETDIKQPASLTVDQVTIHFPFKNGGNRPVTILSAMPVCNCTSVSLDKTLAQNNSITYALGEKGVLTAVFTVDQKTGTQDKYIDVTTDDSPKPLRLTFHVIMPQVAVVIPNHLVWKMDGPDAPQHMKFEVQQSDPVRILNVSSARKDFKVEVETLKKGFSYDIKVTPIGNPPPVKVPILIRTDYPKEKPRTFEGTAEVSLSGQ